MEAVINALENLEKLIYRFLIWIILVPKTLLQVILHPDWAPEYLHKELADEKPRFDEYMSPVVLLLAIALLPYIVWSFLPTPGVDLTSPAIATPSKKHKVSFEANIKFISTSTSGFVTTFWRVEQERYDGTNYTYPALKQVRHTDDYTESNSPDYFNYYQVDSHTIQDKYDYEFSEPGRYWVVVNSSKFDSNGILIEHYDNDIYIFVPDNADDNVVVNSRSKPETNPKFSLSQAAEQLQNETTIFLALGLLIPPLLFAMVTKLFGREALTEDSLKETFYVQCYYFSPIAFVVWATSYAIRFFTPDVFFRFDTDLNLIILLPLALGVFWFISVQTHAIAGVVNDNGWLALGIVTVCVIVLVVGTMLVGFSNNPDLQDFARRGSIWLYPILGVGLITTYHILMAFRGRGDAGSADSAEETVVAISEDDKKKIKSKRFRGDKILAGGIVMIVLISLCLVVVAGTNSPDNITSKDFDVTQRSIVLQSTAIIQSLNAQKFQTENIFETIGTDKGDLKNWSPLMAAGDYSQLRLSSENNVLNFTLDQYQDQATPPATPYVPEDPTVWAYLVNQAFSYTDVQLATTVTDVTNNNTNYHSVSLVCRFNDNGQYEFEITNSGTYTIYVVDFNANEVFHSLASGELPTMRPGSAENTYKVICKGDLLALYVNDGLVDSVRDSTFQNTEGSIGIGLYGEAPPVSMKFSNFKIEAAPSDSNLPAVSDSATPETAATSDASVTKSPSVTEAPVVQTSAPAPSNDQAFYTEDFKGNLDSWIPVTFGDENQAKTTAGDTGLVFNLAPVQDQGLSRYLINEANSYADVKVDLMTTNDGNNSNEVGVVCQVSPDLGWYELDISNSGSYSIYAYDANNDEFTELVYGNSSSIKTGHGTNTVTAVCSGNELSLYVNGDFVDGITDTTFNYTEGNVGVVVSSSSGLPVDVTLNSLTVSQP